VPIERPLEATKSAAMVVRKRPTFTCFHLTPPNSPSLLQVYINSEGVHLA
jgi:hypothetical protein